MVDVKITVTIDSLVIDWCNDNGWEYPTKVGLEWWAIAPNCFIPEPLPKQVQADIAIRQVADAMAIKGSEIARTMELMVQHFEAAILARFRESEIAPHRRNFISNNGFSCELSPPPQQVSEVAAAAQVSEPEITQAMDATLQATERDMETFRLLTSLPPLVSREYLRDMPLPQHDLTEGRLQTFYYKKFAVPQSTVTDPRLEQATLDQVPEPLSVKEVECRNRQMMRDFLSSNYSQPRLDNRVIASRTWKWIN